MSAFYLAIFTDFLGLKAVLQFLAHKTFSYSSKYDLGLDALPDGLLRQMLGGTQAQSPEPELASPLLNKSIF